MRWLDSINITNSMDMNFNKLHKLLKDRGGWCAVVHGVAKSRTCGRDLATEQQQVSTCPIFPWRKTLPLLTNLCSAQEAGSQFSESLCYTNIQAKVV